MNVLTRKIPAYYYDKSNLIRLVLFTAFFDLIFINIYKPFSSLTWYPVSEFKFFIFSSLSYRSTCRGDQSCDHVFLHEEAYP